MNGNRCGVEDFVVDDDFVVMETKFDVVFRKIQCLEQIGSGVYFQVQLVAKFQIVVSVKPLIVAFSSYVRVSQNSIQFRRVTDEQTRIQVLQVTPGWIPEIFNLF